MKTFLLSSVFWSVAIFFVGDLSFGFEWSKTFGGANNYVGRSVPQTNDGGFIIAGFGLSFGSGEYAVYLIKTDALGDELWIKTFDGDDRDEGQSLQLTDDGGFIIAGSTESFGAGMEDFLFNLLQFGNFK